MGGLGAGRHHSQRLGSTDHVLAPQYSPYGREQPSNAYRYPSPSSLTPSPTEIPPTIIPPPSGQYEPRPFNLSSSSNLHSRSTSKTDSVSPFADGEFSQAGRQKAAIAGVPANKPSRFILHTDVDEAIPDEVDIVELPPQYTDRRQPPAGVHRRPSNNDRWHPSNGVRRRPSGNVPPQDIPPTLPDLPGSSPPEGRSWF
jgi:hypothetical protein